MRTLFTLMLVVIFGLQNSLSADGTADNLKKLPPMPPLSSEETSRFEMSPWVKNVNISKTGDLVRIIIKASAPTECYKQREIERIFEKDTVKIVLRLKRPQETTPCTTNKNFDYEEKVYESPIDLAPNNVWILGYEGWHKMKIKAEN